LEIDPSPRLIANADPPDYALGQTDEFWIVAQNVPRPLRTEATLRLVTRHAYWYVEPQFSVSDSDLKGAAEFFDTRIYPEVRRLIGNEEFPGVDNDPRITVFNGDVPGVAGYSSSLDSYPVTIAPFSNERDMVFINLRVASIGSPDYLATLTHEFTHLVHRNVKRSEDTWVKEGLGFMMPALVVPNWPIASGSFSANPDIPLTSWAGDGQGAEPASGHYQAAAWFLRYVIDRFGTGAFSCLLRLDDRGLSRSGLAPSCGVPALFPDVFMDWAVANVVGARPGGGVQPYTGDAPDAPRPRKIERVAPAEVTAAQFGAEYFDLPTDGPVTVDFVGDSEVPVIGAPLGDRPSLWYAVRADDSVASLTHTIDLTRATRAELRYSLWFDLERDFDYAYVVASRDGGRHWELLRASDMTATNPTGSNLGIGYTGQSGSNVSPHRIDQSIDLTSFLGSRVMIGFWVVTDDAEVREGVAIDRVRIDSDDPSACVEESDADWRAEGWARIDPILRQRWSLRAVEFSGSDVRVEVVPVDEQGHATWTSDGRAVDRRVLVVAATTPVTLRRSHYHLAIR